MDNIIIRPIAKAEYEDALEYYLNHSLETAVRFERNFNKALNSIERFTRDGPIL